MPQFFSKKYDDIYFNAADPESEKQFVFVEANQIPRRIRECESFVVAELGFGFGLNCALTMAAANNADAGDKLRYFSVDEAFPETDMIDALQSSLKICSSEYRQIWNLNVHGSAASAQPRLLSGSVYVGAVTDFLKSAAFTADAWYFDGFSPAKNASMWSEEVFARAYALTHAGGTFSTYSSAGWVRRNLLNAGFIVEKVSGFRSKREMLVGYRV